MLMKKFILLYLFTLCTVLCAYSQSAVYVIFTPIESDTKGVEHSVFNIHNLGGGVVHIFTIYNPQIQISAESETKRSIFREKDKTKRSKKESAQHSKSRNKSFVMTSVSAL